MYINTQDLIPTHNKLRNPELVQTFLGNLEFLDKAIECKEDRINIGEVEGNLYVFNSHHRIVVVNIVYGRIKESLLNIKSYTLEEMLSVNLEVGWITPFDPHFFCRIPDFKDKKELMLKKYPRTFDELEFFKKETQSIIEPRTIHTLGELYIV